MKEDKEKATQAIVKIMSELIECENINVTCKINGYDNRKFIEIMITINEE